MILTDDTLEKLERVKCLLGKNLSYEDLLSKMADISIEKIEKIKFKTTQRSTIPPLAAVKKRHVSAHTKREVYQRDQKCTNCGSSFNLNFDHRTPYALGGKSDSSNVRLLCFNCNQFARMQARL